MMSENVENTADVLSNLFEFTGKSMDANTPTHPPTLFL